MSHLARLRAAVLEVGGWSNPSDYATTGAHHRYRRAIVFDRRPLTDALGFALDEFAPVRWAQLAEVGPGGFIRPHCDAGPYWERWHIPIYTAGVFVHGDRVTTPRDGVPFPVAHWEPHAVWNPTDRPRLHLMVDRDAEAHPTGPFQLLPVPAEWEHLIPKEP